MASIMERLGVDEDTPIEHPLLSGAIENAQKRLEEWHFAQRKQVLSFDDVLHLQRNAIYTLRQRVLLEQEVSLLITSGMHEVIDSAIEAFFSDSRPPETWDARALCQHLSGIIPFTEQLISELGATVPSRQAFRERLHEAADEAYALRAARVGSAFPDLERLAMLRGIDVGWTQHLQAIEALQSRLSQADTSAQDSLRLYRDEAQILFKAMQRSTQEWVTKAVFQTSTRSASTSSRMQRRQDKYSKSI